MAKASAEIRSLARAHTRSAITVLASIMNKKNAPEAARVSAASAILDRGWGKPTQPIAGVPDAPLFDVETFAAILNAKLSKLAARK